MISPSRFVGVLSIGVLLGRASLVMAYPFNLNGNVGVSEEWNDNVRFDESDEEDLITDLHLGLGFSYALPTGTISLSASTTARFFALGTQDNTVNLGDNQFITLGTNWQATPRWSFTISDSIARISDTRGLTITQSDDPSFNQNPTGTNPDGTPTDPGVPPPSDPSVPNDNGASSTGDFLLPHGGAFSNIATLGTNYLLTPVWSLHSFYSNSLTNFDDPSDLDIWHRASAGVSYQWNPRLSLSGTYSYSRFNLDSGLDAETHSAHLGSAYALSPTWDVALSGGVFFNHPLESYSSLENTNGNNISSRTGFSGFLTSSKQFELGILDFGVSQGVTPSAGVSGLSLTQNAFARFSRKVREWLSVYTNISFTNYQTDTQDFRTLYLITGFTFPIWREVYGGLYYSYRWRDADESSQNLSAGTVDGNVVAFRIGTSIPVWQGDLSLPF